jgi:hypothetical protein
MPKEITTTTTTGSTTTASSSGKPLESATEVPVEGQEEPRMYSPEDVRNLLPNSEEILDAAEEEPPRSPYPARENRCIQSGGRIAALQDALRSGGRLTG